MPKHNPYRGLKVPRGTLLILGRHTETYWNNKKNLALYNGTPVPARTDDDYDSPLSAVGRIQAVMVGWWLKKSYQGLIKRQGLDHVLLSTSRRSSETWVYMKRAWDTHSGLHTEQRPEITEIKHQSVTSQSQDSITLQDIANEALKLYNHLSVEEQRVAMREYMLSEMLDRGAGEQAIEHAIKKHGTDILASRKHPDGQSYLEKREQIACFMRHYLALLNGRQNTSTLITTHGRTYIALLQLLEGFSDDQARHMQKSEGPPFPPHGGITFFQEENGFLTRRGEWFCLPTCLVVDRKRPRLLDFRKSPALTPKKFAQICAIAGTDLHGTPRNIPKRNAKGIYTILDYGHHSSWPPPLAEYEVPEITDTNLTPISFSRD